VLKVAWARAYLSRLCCFVKVSLLKLEPLNIDSGKLLLMVAMWVTVWAKTWGTECHKLRPETRCGSGSRTASSAALPTWFQHDSMLQVLMVVKNLIDDEPPCMQHQQGTEAVTGQLSTADVQQKAPSQLSCCCCLSTSAGNLEAFALVGFTHRHVQAFLKTYQPSKVVCGL